MRDGLSPLSGLICLEELLLPKKSMFIESKAPISRFHCNPDRVPQSLRSHQFLGCKRLKFNCILSVPDPDL